jgi:DNA-binding SARP family transcriptional activator
MQVSFLGSLRVTGQGGVTQICAPQQRTLLVSLAVQAGGVVSMDMLAEVIWGSGTLPNSWRDTLRNLVRRLRATLGADSSRILTSTPGYLLDVNPDDVDMLAFEAKHKSGLAAARNGDWQLTLDTLTAAVALWRGTPFTDVPSALLRDAYLPYLEDQWIDVQATRIEAALRLAAGTSGGVVPGLRQLTAQYPAHERFRWLLMLALIRSGRKADALAAYRSAWDFSIGELGVEPGHALKDLNQRILVDDESLADELPAQDTPALASRYAP